MVDLPGVFPVDALEWYIFVYGISTFIFENHIHTDSHNGYCSLHAPVSTLPTFPVICSLDGNILTGMKFIFVFSFLISLTS